MAISPTSKARLSGPAEAAVRGAARFNDRVQVRSHELISELKHLARKDKEYIYKNGAGECTAFPCKEKCR